ncbi:YtxH domain-containing protein [Candidatus Poribacteria bacterium]|jgi:gas vesicle protein|nr:YtxH domain-containing protein [Candidatus Poribacteria bacterium]|tara:strand:- start:306 stop:686 length:381 start_codon:yes stop_codon:yes gene_type:complete
MSNDSNNSVLAVVLAFFTGGLIGSALAVLLTPFSGRETRERIVESTIDTREKTVEIAGQVSEIVSQSISAGTKAFQDKREDIKTTDIVEESLTESLEETVITDLESERQEEGNLEVLEPFAEKTTG